MGGDYTGFHGSPWIRNPLHAARRSRSSFASVGFALLYVAVRPRAGGAVQRDAGAARRRLADRGRAGRRRRLPARRRRRRRCGRSSTTCARRRSIRASRAVLLKPTGFESPFWGKVQEMRDAVLDFRKSGKPVYAYLEYGGDREYYLATAADKVFLMPSSAARSDRRRHLRAVPARHARQDRRLSRICTTSATTRPPSTPSPRRATPPRTRRWTSRSTAICTSRSCAASPTAARRTKPTCAR